MTSRLIRVTQRLALVSLLALGLTQCTRMLPILVDRAPCASDLECPSSELCVMGACLSQDIQATETLSFEVKPPEDSGLLAQQFVDFIPTNQERFELVLRQSVTMKGILQQFDQTGMLALIVATPTSGIPGRSLVVSSSTDDMGYFELELVEGLEYRWSIYPENNTYAPLFLNQIKAEEQSDWGEPIAFANPEELRSVQGRLMAFRGDSENTEPVPGMQVRVFSGDRLISSAARSDEEGAFLVRVPDGDFENVKLEVLPAEDAVLFPTVHVENLILDQVSDLGDVDLGQWSSNTDVDILVLTTEGEAVVGAKVYARGTMGKGHFQQLTATDENGQVNAVWPDNIYNLAIVPPTTSPAATTVLEGIRFTELDGGLTVRLGARQPLQGVVWAPSGPPVSGTALEFMRKSDNDGANPDVLIQEVVIDEERTNLDFVFPEPSVISGTLIQPDGEEALPLANVQAFRTRSESEEGISQQLQWLGENLADELGNFDILIPE